MKKFMIILLSIINIFMIVILVSLYKVYDNSEKELVDILDGKMYSAVIDELELKKNKIINSIKERTGYILEDVNTFDEIKDKLEDEVEKISLENEELVNKKEQLSVQNKNLKKTYNEILEEERKKNTYIIEGVPKINQYTLGYPTGCESAALTNLLNFWGVSVNMKEIVDVLPKGELPYYENEIRYGGNPYLEFVGHPNDSSSYGVYEKPIIGIANKFKSGIIDGTGMSLDNVLNIVKEGRPVMVWVSMNMRVPYVSSSWIYKPTGEKINWLANEHSLLVIGFNDSQVIVSDSLNGGVRYYDKNVFKSRYNTYGKRALYY